MHDNIDSFDYLYNKRNDDRLFSDEELKKIGQIKLFAKFCLFFVKKQTFSTFDHIITFKVFRGVTYIISVNLKLPMHPMCRCAINEAQFKRKLTYI